jgi:hypothetical protein
MSFDPGQTRQAEWAKSELPGAAPAGDNDEGSPRGKISGLDRTAFDLAVYASSWGLPAITQDSLPAAGPALPDGMSYPQGSYKRFHVMTILLFRASWRYVPFFLI